MTKITINLKAAEDYLLALSSTESNLDELTTFRYKQRPAGVSFNNMFANIIRRYQTSLIESSYKLRNKKYRSIYGVHNLITNSILFLETDLTHSAAKFATIFSGDDSEWFSEFSIDKYDISEFQFVFIQTLGNYYFDDIYLYSEISDNSKIIIYGQISINEDL